MDKSQKLRKHFYISGRVQGVGFRYRAFYATQSLGLTGWVKNLDDGRVEMEAQGLEDDITRLLKKLEQGSFIRIESCEARNIPVEEENGFRITGD